jgi:hypothetical protein
MIIRLANKAKMSVEESKWEGEGEVGVLIVGVWVGTWGT